MSRGDSLNLSSVSDNVEGLLAAVDLAIPSLQLSLELVDVLLGHGVDGSELVPVHVFCAWRSGN